MDQFFSAPISSNMSETPEGYLICHNVPLARTGMQEYRLREIPEQYGKQWPELGPEDKIKVWKTKDELFHPDTIASYNGKAVTDEHPPNLFDITEHADYDCGHVMNPRAGEQQEADGEWYLYGDLMIQDQELIDKVRGGYKRQVSCGATNGINRREDGDGEQTDIRGNHVAVVPKGRAGPLAGIRDHEEVVPHKEKQSMANIIEMIFGTGVKEYAKTASPEDLHELVSLNLKTKPKGTRDADDDGDQSEISKLAEMVKKLDKSVSDIREQMGKATNESSAKNDDGEEASEGTEDAADDKKDKKDKKDEEGTEDGEIELPKEDQPKDALKAIGTADSVDALLDLKSAVKKSKNAATIKAWNSKYRKLSGTNDDYSEFAGATARRSKAATTHDELVAKAQANYDAARRGTK